MINGNARQWALRFGLATAPLFEGETGQAPGEHTLLLDGMHGTFAMSEAEDELWRSFDPATWVWSSDVPHHITITKSKVAVVRWDRPDEARVFERDSIERSLDRFYGFLTEDRVRSNRGVVEHLLGFFRRLRSLAHASGVPDARATDVFTAALARLLIADATLSPELLGLSTDSEELLTKLDQKGLQAALEEAGRGAGTLSWIRLHPSLAIRHAGGQLFQEAHFELLRGATDFDLFGLVGVSEVSAASRGGTHFTPATLARSLVERAIASLSEPIAGRDALTICDPACGSGAFLHEALRALRRTGFEGRLQLIGYDISPAAISMARFAVSASLRDWEPKGGVQLDLRVADSLTQGMPAADIIVMNPPFVGFGAQTRVQRQQLIDALGTPTAGRGDFSMAFIVKALEALNAGGTLGTLFPASLLSLKAASTWRERLLDLAELRFLASIGDYGLFSHALVQVAAAVFTKGHLQKGGDFLALITENDAQATSVALRQLRRQEGNRVAGPVVEDAWSLFPVAAEALRNRPSWRLPTPRAERILRAITQAGLPSVRDLFEISQGIQTGLNEALLLTDDELSALPAKERRYFRRATMTDSIQHGRIVKTYWLFFPYGLDGPTFASEQAVRDAVPNYFARYLAPHEQRLRSRAAFIASPRPDWWGLMTPRSKWSVHARPRIISKFFGAEGAFFGDLDATYLAVMGHVWTLKQHGQALDVAGEETGEGIDETDLLAAYVGLCNSLPFSKLLGLYAPSVAGGQFDLSARHVGPVPVPDLQLMAQAPDTGRAVRELAGLGREMRTPSADWEQRANALTSYLYGGVDFDAI